MGLYVSIGIFLLMQVAAALLFKWGSTAPSLWWWGFLLGNMIGVSSIYFMMYVYARMQPNLALAICVGISFLLTQFALSLVFRNPMSMLQWCGVLLMVGGIFVIAYGGKKPQIEDTVQPGVIEP